MTLLFDTSAVIGLTERQSPTLTDLVVRSTSPIVISPITLGELEHGVATSPDTLRVVTLDLARSSMHHEFFDPHLGASCYATLRSSPAGIGANDAWIAATAVTGGHQLVTQDAQLADAVEGIDWTTSPWQAPSVILVPIGE